MNPAQEIASIDITGLIEMDSEFAQLQKTCGPVAVYRYDASSHSWKYTDVVGSLYLYARYSQPLYGMMVKGHQNSIKFLQKFDSNAVFVMHQSYLLVRTKQSIPKNRIGPLEKIHCIWFHKPQNCVASANILRSMGLKFEGQVDPFDAVGELSKISFEGHSELSWESPLYDILRTGTKQPIDFSDLVNDLYVL